MAYVLVPTFSDPFYDMTVTLDGVAYVFDFRFNQDDETWAFSLSLEDGTPLVTGIKVVCGTDLLWRCQDPRKPWGLLTAIPATSDNSPPRQNDLGEDKRVRLTYMSPADILDDT